jgi:hypothetical protein
MTQTLYAHMNEKKKNYPETPRHYKQLQQGGRIKKSTYRNH